MNININMDNMESNNEIINESNYLNNIYFNNVIIKKINVKSKFLNENIDNYIFQYIKDKVEGLCIYEGYVKPDTVKIIKRSVGMLLGSRFTGDISYDVVYTAQVCNPVVGNIIDCKVKFINKLGILGHNGPISIIIGKQLQKNDDFNHINIDDTIKVEVIAKKFSLNDKEIKIVARLYNENDKNNNKKYNKKEEFLTSDLTPILNDNEYNDLDIDNLTYNSDENEDLVSIDEDENDLINSDDEIEEEEEDIKLENPDENNIEVEEIELEDDVENEEDFEEDNESIHDYD
jgi:DNA-directed RNA polymerase subunit E'/Rpb7